MLVNIDLRRYTAKMSTPVLLPLRDVAEYCTPITQGALSAPDAETLARALKVLADPARLRVISLIAASPESEACVCDLVDALELSQPTVSHHLKQLVEAGFLVREKRGTWAWYTLVPGSLEALAKVLVP